MKRFKIQIPLELEQKANFNTHDFSSSNDLEFKFENDEFTVLGSDGKYSVLINEIKAKNRDECANIARNILTKIMKICSLIIQSQHSNQHYTHLRLNYDINKIDFTSEYTISEPIKLNDGNMKIVESLSITDSVAMKSISRITLDTYTELSICYEDKSFSFILDAFYRAIDSTDEITKFFNAFSAIEFIEASFVNVINTQKLVSEEAINTMIQSVEKILVADTYKRIKERIRNNLSNATFESRADKLLSIVKNVFKIDSISSGIIKTEINSDFIKGIISIRNSLFHGKKIDESIKNEIGSKSLELILLLQNILTKWINIERE